MGKGAKIHMGFSPRSAQHHVLFFREKIHMWLHFMSKNHTTVKINLIVHLQQKMSYLQHKLSYLQQHLNTWILNIEK